MKNAKTFSQTLVVSPDGNRYGKYPLGRYVSPTLVVAGWGQTANGGIVSGGTITGPVPLAIFCHAIGSNTSNASLEPFREMGYHFDFGYVTPNTAGIWQYSNKPKGNQVGGPVAAHVYETPGTYQISLNAQDPTGNSFNLWATVVAVDANTYWSAAQGRANTLVQNSSTSVWPTWANNTRYLLEAGADYTRLGTLNLEGKNNVHIQKWGSGSKPLIHSLSTGGTTSSPVLSTKNIIFDNLDANSSATVTDFFYESVGGTMSSSLHSEDAMFYKCDGIDVKGGTLIDFSSSLHPELVWYRPRRTTWYECVWYEKANTAANAQYPYLTQVYESAVLGCRSVSPSEHGLRIAGMQYGIIAHNRLPTRSQKSALTIRSNGVQNASIRVTYAGLDKTPATRFVVAADNYLGTPTDTTAGGTLLGITPQNDNSTESHEYVVGERNIYEDIPGASTDGSFTYAYMVGNRNITIRDSLFKNTALSNRTEAPTGAAIDYGNTRPTGIGNVSSPDYVSQNISPTPPWYHGPWYSNELKSTNLADGVYRFTTPTGILPVKAGS